MRRKCAHRVTARALTAYPSACFHSGFLSVSDCGKFREGGVIDGDTVEEEEEDEVEAGGVRGGGIGSIVPLLLPSCIYENCMESASKSALRIIYSSQHKLLSKGL